MSLCLPLAPIQQESSLTPAPTVAPLLLLTSLFLLGAGSNVGTAAPDAVRKPVIFNDCECKVINSRNVTNSGGSCTTGGASVPCFSVSAATYPDGGSPQSGICNRPPQCEGADACAYKTMEVVVTIAPCAGGPSGCDLVDPVPWELDFPGGTDDQSGTQSVNSTKTFTVPALHISPVCGTPETKVTLKFTKRNLLTACEVEFSFGCGQCDAAHP